MDHKMYYPTQSDYGVFSVRRLPKGRTYPAPGVPEGPTVPTDPNANPVTISRFHNAGGVTPHALTERWSYTVPRNRRAQVQSAMAHLVRSTAAAPVNDWLGVIRVERSGVPTQDIDLIRAHSFSNTVGERVEMNHTGPFELFEGDRIFAATLDNSTGGGVGYDLTLLAIEYDAIHRVIGTDSGGFIGQGNNLGEGLFTPQPSGGASTRIAPQPIHTIAPYYPGQRYL